MHKPTGILIQTLPGHVAPTDLIDRAIKDFPNVSGYAVALKEEGEEYFELISQVYNAPVKRDAFDDMQLKTSDALTTFFFGGPVPGGVEDVQPFLLVKGPDWTDSAEPGAVQQGPPMLVGYFVGDFSGYADPKSGHSPEHNAAAQLGKKLQEISSKSGNDLDVLVTHLRSPAFKKEAEALFNKEGTIILMDADGEVHSYGNVSIDQLEWGYHTAFPVAEVKAAPVPEATAPKKKNRFNLGGAPATAVEPDASIVAAASTAQQATEASKTSVPATGTPKNRFSQGGKPTTVAAEAAATAPKTSTTPTKAVEKEFVYAHPIAMSNNKVKDWYQKFTGTYPEKFKECPVVQIRMEAWKKTNQRFRDQAVVIDETTIKDFRTLGTVISQEKLTPASVVEAKAAGEFPITSGKDIKEQRKDVAPHHVSAVSAEMLPIISPESRGKIHMMMKAGTLLKTVDASSVEVLDPKMINELEQKFPSFGQLLGMDGFTITDRWSFEMLCKLCRELPDAGAKLLFDYRLDSMKGRAAQLIATGKPINGQILDSSGKPITSQRLPDAEVDVTGKTETVAAQPKKNRFNMGAKVA